MYCAGLKNHSFFGAPAQRSSHESCGPTCVESLLQYLYACLAVARCLASSFVAPVTATTDLPQSRRRSSRRRSSSSSSKKKQQTATAIMGLMDNAKKFAAKTKFHSELVMIDREIKTCKAKHAVILYDQLLQRHEDANKEPLPVEGLEAAFLAAMEDMQELVAKRREKDDAMDALEEDKKKQAAAEAHASRETTGEKAKAAAKHAGRVVQNESTMAKLKAEMTYYGREMKVRKEIFGVQVFDDLDILSRDGRFEEGSDGIGAALNHARDEINEIAKKRKDKEEDIKALG